MPVNKKPANLYKKNVIASFCRSLIGSARYIDRPFARIHDLSLLTTCVFLVMRDVINSFAVFMKSQLINDAEIAFALSWFGMQVGLVPMNLAF